MKTELIKLNDYLSCGSFSAEDLEKLQAAADFLSAAELVAFPTETVYGLGGNALLPDAAKRIYAAKGRPSDNPLIVHIADMEALPALLAGGEIPKRAKRLADCFWPGPLTMVLKKSEQVPLETTGGLSTVAVRMPKDKVARELIRLSKVPVAAPSANVSGRPSPTTAAHCMEDLNGKVRAVVDGGACDIGVESTIIDLSGDKPVLLRPGAVTVSMLSEALGEPVLLDPALEKPLEAGVKPKAPGMKYRHYAPKAPMVIVQTALDAGAENKDALPEALKKTEECIHSSEKAIAAEPAKTEANAALTDEKKVLDAEWMQTLSEKVLELVREKREAGLRTGIICSDETKALYEAEVRKPGAEIILKSIGSRQRERSVAHNLFAILREMDELSADFIVAEGFCQKEIGYAIMNRLKKAAAQQIIYV